MKRKRYSVPKEEKLQIKRWDPIYQEKPYQYTQEWEAEIQTAVEDCAGKKGRTANPEFTGPMAERRKKAVLYYLPRVIGRYPNYPGAQQGVPNLIGQHWIRLNYHNNSLAMLEQDMHILFAASIWILDQVMEDFEKRSAMFSILPKDEMLLEDLYLMDAWSPDFSEDLVTSVEYVLHHRNEDIHAIEKDPYKNPYVLTDVVTAKRENKQAVPSRESFEKMISLIPEKKVQEACLRFKEKFWQWVDDFFGGMEALDDETCKVIDKVNQHVRRHNRVAAELENAAEEVERQSKKNPFPAGPFRIDQPIPNTRNQLFTQIQERMEKLEQIDQHFGESLGEMEECLRKRLWYISEISDLGRLSSDCGETYGDAVAERYQIFSGFDPFEFCFALVYLIDQQDELVWLTGAISGFMAAVGMALPWGFYEYDEFQDPIWNPDEEGSVHSRRRGKAEVRWNDRVYLDSSDDPYDHYERSLAQIIYEDTGCLLPRNLQRYEGHRKELSRWGIKGKDAAMVLACMNLLSTAKRQDEAFNLKPRMMSDMSVLDELEKKSENKRDSEENLRALSREKLEEMIREFRKDAQSYSRSIHLMEQNLRHLKREKERQEKEAAVEHQELVSLRELLFRADLGGEAETESSDLFAETELPYSVQNPILIFGGHDSWSKAIRPLLKGNVRFIGKDENFDLGIISRTSIIWVQPNAISHSQYYRMIDEARRLRKQVKYFSFASAEKCAMQIVQEELGSMGK